MRPGRSCRVFPSSPGKPQSLAPAVAREVPQALAWWCTSGKRGPPTRMAPPDDSRQAGPASRAGWSRRRRRHKPNTSETAMIQLPIRDPCDLCVAAREEKWKIIEEGEHALTVINPWQFETGQCCVITRRHVATLLDLSDLECAAILVSARKVAEALVKAYRPLGILTFQNNGVFSGQETPHFHFHVVPRQTGSDWGIGPPQLATFDGAGRERGTVHDPGGEGPRRERVQVSAAQLAETVSLIRSKLPQSGPPAAGSRQFGRRQANHASQSFMQAGPTPGRLLTRRPGLYSLPPMPDGTA
ncbi:MAG: HIT family protein [Lysobacteraceae bacterium]|nr:MAG: HIT family protein [Xanthomonadaceae bacterium]